MIDCVEVDSPALTTAQADNVLPDGVYVGPWYVGDTGYTDTIDIGIQPETAGAGNDLFIWLTQNANKMNAGTIGDFYGIRKL